MTEIYNETTKGKRIRFSDMWLHSSRGPEGGGYDRYELYDEEKEYYEGSFTADYGHGPRRYVWKAHGSNFMVAHLFVTPEELKELAPFCRCSVCIRREWLHKNRCCYLPTVLIDIYATCTSGCPCCHGCIKSNDVEPRDHILRWTYAYRAKKLG